MSVIEPSALRDGIGTAPVPVVHREEEYDSRGFELLRRMQRRHFWYRGRHRFLRRAVQRHVADSRKALASARVIDLGGGCGGWLAYFLRRQRGPIAEVALADSSRTALRLAGDCLPAKVKRYQVDLLDLPWENRWDVAFLLDVLEHLPQEKEALQQIHQALAPGGFLFVTMPALQAFWSWNDEVSGHQRRYSRGHLRTLARSCGYRLVDARYFMFFLTPLYLASRLGRRPPLEQLSREEAWRLMERTHRVPPTVVNSLLYGLFWCETPLGHCWPFPWGTSLLGVLQKLG